MVLTCSDARTIALRMGWGWDGAQEEAQMEDSPLVYYPTWRSLPWPPAICDDLLFRGIELDCREWQSAVKQLQPRDGSRSSNQEACYLLAIKEGKRDVEGKQPMGFIHGFLRNDLGFFFKDYFSRKFSQSPGDRIVMSDGGKVWQ